MSKIEERAIEDLKNKIELESLFEPEIIALFLLMVRQSRIFMSSSGRQIDFNLYFEDWKTLLKKHYRRVEKKFSQTKNDAFLLSILEWQNINSTLSSNKIIATSNFNLRQAINEAIVELNKENKPLDNLTISFTANAILKKKLQGRVTNVKIFETQASAEATKQLQAESESGLLQGQTRVDKMGEKKWVTMGDNKVRNMHRFANGQKRKINEPYTVGGQQLMHPGDRSMGATTENVAGCRCSSIFTF